MQLDHLILNANDVEVTARFYVEVMGFRDEGNSEPFRVIRVSPDFEILLGNMQGPSLESRAGGARGRATSLYFLDPNRHMIEIRHYE